MRLSPTSAGAAGDPDRLLASVVIPTWNRAGLLPGCLASLATQDYPTDSWELIVVDDGSSDDTEATVARMSPELAERGVDFVYEPRTHEGLNAARNAGIAKARGDVVCFLDDDVRTPPGWLSAMVRGIVANPGAAAYGGPIDLVVEGRPPRSCGREELGETLQDWGPEVTEPTTLFGANLTVTKEGVRRFGLFDTDIVCGSGDETEWLARVQRQGGRLLYLPEARLEHLRRPEDIRLRRLMARRYERGRGQVDSAGGTGAAYTLLGELGQVLRSLIHSLRYRCALGLLPVAMSGGRVVGLIRSRRFSVS